MSEFRLEDLRKITGTEKVTKTRQPKPKPQSIVVESDRPPASIIALSEALKNLPAPEHTMGDIVIVPPAVYGLVRFSLWEPTHRTWVYAVFLEADPDKIHYFPEAQVRSQ